MFARPVSSPSAHSVTSPRDEVQAELVDQLNALEADFTGSAAAKRRQSRMIRMKIWRRERMQRCKTYFKKFIEFLFSHVGLCCVVVLYSILGGFLFQLLEGPSELMNQEQNSVSKKRSSVVKDLFHLTVQLNVLAKHNWTRMADQLVYDFQKDLITAVKSKVQSLTVRFMYKRYRNMCRRLKRSQASRRQPLRRRLLRGAGLRGTSWAGTGGSTAGSHVNSATSSLVHHPTVIANSAERHNQPSLGHVPAIDRRSLVMLQPAVGSMATGGASVTLESPRLAFTSENTPPVSPQKRPRRTLLAFFSERFRRSSSLKRKSSHHSIRSAIAIEEHPDERAVSLAPSAEPSAAASASDRRSVDGSGSGIGGGGGSSSGGGGQSAILGRTISAADRTTDRHIDRLSLAANSDLVDYSSPGCSYKAVRYNVKNRKNVELLELKGSRRDYHSAATSVGHGQPHGRHHKHEKVLFSRIDNLTVGFGDYVPGKLDNEGGQAKLIFCALYLLFGLAIICMAFDLMQEEVKNKFRWLACKIGIMDERG